MNGPREEGSSGNNINKGFNLKEEDMKASAKFQALNANNDLSINNNGDLSELREKTGLVSRFKADRAANKARGEALKIVEIEKVHAKANIALTAIKLAEASIRASLVGNAMPQIGALTTRVNAATAAVNQALTNGAAAEVYTHIRNRASNIDLANELYADGKIDKEEAEVLISFAKADAIADIESSRRQEAEAKEAVSALHSHALKGIAESKDRIL
jgi:hypothetical protein